MDYQDRIALIVEELLHLREFMDHPLVTQDKKNLAFARIDELHEEIQRLKNKEAE